MITADTNEIFLISTIISVVVIVLLLLKWIQIKDKLKDFQNRHKAGFTMIEELKAENSLDSNLTSILNTVGKYVQAPSYAFYILDSKSNLYMLKSIRNRLNFDGNIGPSYSNLAPYKKETFIMPSAFPREIAKDKVFLIKEGEVPLVLMPIKGNKGLIVIGPVTSVDKQNLNILGELSTQIKMVLEYSILMEEMDSKVKLVVSNNNAVKNVSSLFTDTAAMLEIILSIALKTINVRAGFFLINNEGQFKLEALVGLNEVTKKLISIDESTHKLFFEILGDNKLVYLTKGNKDFFRIPPYFIAAEIEVMILVKVDSENGKGLAVFCHSESRQLKDYQIAGLQVMSRRMSDIMDNISKFQQLSYSYIEILKTLARLIDNISKHTVGYSELMYRYSVIISKEMKLNPEEVKEIGIAAYLSNIGVIGLSDDLLNKKGKFREIEYEMMKLHSDAGASIIEATIGNSNMASYIRYHHERIDGYGYPGGLKGKDIPLGARIIAVVQTFLAKMLSREYRTSLPFEQTLKQLQACAGSQLDGEVVDALINWFEKKEKAYRHKKTSLGRCFEMRCSPENICTKCEAFTSNSKNCWEFPDNNCAEHGNTCDSCFIYTEYLHRTKMK